MSISINEAIGHLKWLAESPASKLTDKEREAVKLGIEALEHVKAVRVFSGAKKPPLLQGETPVKEVIGTDLEGNPLIKRPHR